MDQPDREAEPRFFPTDRAQVAERPRAAHVPRRRPPDRLPGLSPPGHLCRSRQTRRKPTAVLFHRSGNGSGDELIGRLDQTGQPPHPAPVTCSGKPWHMHSEGRAAAMRAP